MTHPALLLDGYNLMFASVVVLTAIFILAGFSAKPDNRLAGTALSTMFALLGIGLVEVGFWSVGGSFEGTAVQYTLAVSVCFYSFYFAVREFRKRRRATSLAYLTIISLMLAVVTTIGIDIGLGTSLTAASIAWWVTSALFVAWLLSFFKQGDFVLSR